MKMKIVNTIRCFVMANAIFAFCGLGQIAFASSEIISNFDANIAIQSDGVLSVTEWITYDFGSNEKHGIFRDIPLTAVDGPDLNITVSDVNDEFENAYNYTTSVTNNILHIKIGDPDVFISGVKTYSIKYEVNNAIRSFDGHDELYWNITGNGWDVAIQNATASVTLPDSKMTDIQMDCFTGDLKSKEKNCTYNKEDSYVNYATSSSLDTKEGFTIVLGMPLGYIKNTYLASTASENTGDINFGQYIFAIIALFSFFGLFQVIRLFTKGYKLNKPIPVMPSELSGQPIVVAYRPPNKLAPIDIGMLLNRRVDMEDISSVIMDLAVRGYIKIRYTVEEIKFWPDRKDFELIKLKNGDDLTHPAEKILFKLLFPTGSTSRKLSDLGSERTKIQDKIIKIKENTEKNLRENDYFDNAAFNEAKKVKRNILITFLILFFCIFISGPYGIIFFILLFLVVIFFLINIVKLDHKLTPKGISALAQILGFQEFLELTEKDKLKLLNAPDLEPEMFEKFLPYAMVLGVEEEWAKKFEGIYKGMPGWYEDSTMTYFNSTMLTESLTHFSGSFDSACSTSSSGLSGGSSGGGSGGGGGGSW